MTTALWRQSAAAIAQALPDDASMTPEQVAEALAVPPDRNLGDLAFPCFKLAKSLRQAPPAIAATLAAALNDTDLFSAAQAAGPYVNLQLRSGPGAELALAAYIPAKLEPQVTREQRVMVEFSQPNTHKAFHVGHMRNLCLGDALVRLLRADGYDVLAANYYGDVGAHIAKCLWWYVDHCGSPLPPPSHRGEWLGELYAQASNQLDAWEEAAKAGELTAQQALGTARARITEFLQKLEARDPEVLAIWQQTRQWSLDEFAEIYRWCGVEFDRVFYESDVDEPGLRIVDEFLSKGIFVESDGAVGIFNEEVKHMPFFMLRKRDGTGLYATKDLALARLKFESDHIDRSIYVVDSRQSDHFRHVFLTLQKMGFAQASACQHVPYEMVELPSGAMATRSGNVILFRSLRERMVNHVLDHYLAKYRGDWSEAEIERCAHLLALGAIKYGMLARDVNQKIVFDLEAWLELEGNTGPYLQYTTARVGSILRKGEQADIAIDPVLMASSDRRSAVFAALGQPEERELMIAIDQVAVAVQQAAAALRPSVLCAHLHELAKATNRFVNSKQCRVLQSEGDTRQARLLLTHAAHQALTWGLARLGIEAPPRM